MKIEPIRKSGPHEGTDGAWRRKLFDDLLRGVRLQSSVHFHPAFRAPWGIRVARDCGVFHVVDQGRCWLDLEGLGEPIELSEGDFVVITRGQPHSMRDHLSTPVVNFFELAQKHSSEPKGAVWFGGDGDVTRMICGGMVFENADSAWLVAARDEQIGRALAILHSHPHRPWTVGSLAQQVGMSRSTFAARFSELVGEPPLHYFTRIRINSAATRMRRTRDKLSLVAAEAGYSSVTAFSKAFKRFLGSTPGEHRMSRAG